MKSIKLTNIIKFRNNLSDCMLYNLNHCRAERHSLQIAIFISIRNKINTNMENIGQNISRSLIKMMK